MNIASTLPQTEAEFFDEKGLPKEYRPPVQQHQQYQPTGSMFVLKKIQGPSNAILLSEDGREFQHSVLPEDGIEIQHNISTPIAESAPAPASILSPDFPFQEFLLTEVVTQSRTDISSISDTLDSRENSNSSRKASRSTDLPLKSGLNSTSHEEIGENCDSTISEKHIQSSRDSSTISIPDNSNPRKSISGITPDTTPVTPDVQSSKNRSVMPTDIQALTVLQDLVSVDFQAKSTPSTQRKGEDTHLAHPDTHSTQRKGEDEAFQLIQKIHNQLQQVQWDLQRLHSLHKYKN